MDDCSSSEARLSWLRNSEEIAERSSFRRGPVSTAATGRREAILAHLPDEGRRKETHYTIQPAGLLSMTDWSVSPNQLGT